MKIIVSDFPNLPQDENQDFKPTTDSRGEIHGPKTWPEERARLYKHVYSDLKTQGHPLPAKAADQITRAELLTHLQGIAAALVADYDSRVHTALHRLPYAPNVLTDEDLAAVRGAR
jgi:hypothetical protein